MKYAICNELYTDWPLDKAFAHAASTGYTGIEIAPFTLGESPTKISSDQRQFIRELASTHGLEVVGLHWLLAKTDGLHLTSPDAATRARTGAYLNSLARLCGDLGGQLMVFGSPAQRNLAAGVTQQQGFDYAVEVLKSCAPTFEECGVVLALEPLGPQEGNFMLTAADGIELAAAIDSPAVKLHLDVKAMSSEEKSIPDIIRDSRSWMVHFHANDPNLQGPGMGEVGFAPIFQALSETGYDGWVSVEVFDYAPGIEALAGGSLKYMQAVEREIAADN